jgi:ABC-type Mn2+/Zn2+ transport system permease subunit
MLEVFQYDFIIRGLEAGIIVSLIAPLIGIFLVLRGKFSGLFEVLKTKGYHE